MSKYDKGKKQILREITIGEISAVDKPAQPGATVSIMKRKGSKKITKSNGGPAKMTVSVKGHQHLVELTDWDGNYRQSGYVSYETAEGDEHPHSHPWYYDSKGGLVIGESLGHRHDIDEIQKAKGKGAKPMKLTKALLATAALTLTAISKFDDEDWGEKEAGMIKKAAISNDVVGALPDDGPLSLTKADKEKMSDEDEEKKKMKEKMEKFQSIAELSKSHRDHYDKLSDGEKDDFLKMDTSGRETSIQKASSSDPVVYTTISGVDIRKSAGDAVLAMAKENDETKRELAKSRLEAETIKIAKKAAELTIAGDEDVKKALVGAIETIKDEDLRKRAYESLKSAAAIDKDDFNGAGKLSKGDVDSAEKQLDGLVKSHMQANKGSTYEQSYLEVAKSADGAVLYGMIRKGAA